MSLAFLDDGVYQLMKGQNTSGIGMKNFSPTYRALGDYDVKKLYVEKESLDERGLKPEDLMEITYEDEDEDLRGEAVGPPREPVRVERDHGAARRSVEFLIGSQSKEMSTLHTVNKSPFERSAFISALNHLRPGDTVLMIEDAVVGARKGSAFAERLANAAKSCTVYVLGARSCGPRHGREWT